MNNEAHKRKIVPRALFFCTFTTFCHKINKFVLKNAEANVLYTFKDNEEKKDIANKLISVISEIERVIKLEAYIHRVDNPTIYSHTYEEANFVHRAIFNGFDSKSLRESPYSNWFGVSIYSPDAILLRNKDNKKIHLSFNGATYPLNKIQQNESLMKLARNRSIKYLAFIENGEAKYETFTGELPDNEFIENFIKPVKVC
jgi:hypothetical protein